MPNGETPCLPCLKKIIDEDAATKISCLEFLRVEVANAVLEDRMDSVVARSFYEEAMAIESEFIAKAGPLIEKTAQAIRGKF